MRTLSFQTLLTRALAVVLFSREGREQELGLTPGSTGLAALAG